MDITIASICARWRDPTARPLFRGRLIDDDCAVCAQGDVLRLAGWDDARLRLTDQVEADRAVARLLGIPVAQAILLRNVNDSIEGCPQDVLGNPERVLGDQAPRVLSFWRRLDAQNWVAFNAARDAARDAAWDAAWDAARDAAWDAAWEAAGAAAGAAAAGAAASAAVRAAVRAAAWAVRAAAAGASNEIQGAALLPKLFFLPLFGISHLSELDRE